MLTFRNLKWKILMMFQKFQIMSFRTITNTNNKMFQSSIMRSCNVNLKKWRLFFKILITKSFNCEFKFEIVKKFRNSISSQMHRNLMRLWMIIRLSLSFRERNRYELCLFFKIKNKNLKINRFIIKKLKTNIFVDFKMFE